MAMLSEEQLIRYILNHGYIEITIAMLDRIIGAGTEASINYWAATNNFTWQYKAADVVRIWKI